MRRHLRYQKRFSVLTIGIVLILLGVVGTIGWYTNHQRNDTAEQNTKQAAKAVYNKPSDPVSAAADSYIISRVGQERFLQYFKPIKLETANTTATAQSPFGPGVPVNSAESSFRSYHFKLLKMVTQDDIVVVKVDTNNPALTVGSLIPNCQRDKSLCDFKITKKQALETASKRDFKPADLEISWDNFLIGSTPLAIKLVSCSENKVMFIDYRNGRVLDFRADLTACPKITPQAIQP